MSLIIDGREVLVPGVITESFVEDPTLAFTDKRDFTLRKTPVKSICVHTRLGLSNQSLCHYDKHMGRWEYVGVKRASADDRAASWHISIGPSGNVACHLDLVRIQAYHCGQVNKHSIGIELYQDSNGRITYETLESCVKVIDVITRELGIQRQFPKEDNISVRFARRFPGVKRSSRLAYLRGGREGSNFYGIFGHRNATKNRGPGDPGNFIFKELEKAGYESFEVSKNHDIDCWKHRQKLLGFAGKDVDGIPGPATTASLNKAGYPHGLYVRRPGD